MPWDKQFDVDEVLEKAMLAFWERGYEATSMQDLVNCTGVHRGSLYATYQDKHSLFVGALRRYDERVRRAMLAKLEATYGPREAIRHLFQAFIAQAPAKGGSRGCFLTNSAIELAAHDSSVGKIVSHAQEDLEGFFVRLIDAGKASGEIPAQVHTATTAQGLLASLLGLLVLVRSRPDKALLQGIVADALHRIE